MKVLRNKGMTGAVIYRDMVVANISTIDTLGGERFGQGGLVGQWSRESCCSPALRRLERAGKISVARSRRDRALLEHGHIQVYPMTNLIRRWLGLQPLKPKRLGYWLKPHLDISMVGGKTLTVWFESNAGRDTAREELIKHIEAERGYPHYEESE